MAFWKLRLFGTLCCFGVGLLGAQSNVILNPFSAPEDVAAGALSFRSQGAACHGLVASGAAGPSLTTGAFRRGHSAEAQFGVMSKGVPGPPLAAVKREGR